jgi:AcrR family transcriptional regulator
MSDLSIPTLEDGGLRARKKQETRSKIVAEAERLFRERGYSRVRMIDVAKAADVSEPTLYNYFPTKEHLVFDMDQELEERIVACIQGVTPGKKLMAAVRAGALKFLDDLCGSSPGSSASLPKSVLQGEALQRVWLQLNARIAYRVAEVLESTTEPRVPRATALILGRFVVSVFAVVLEEYGAGKMKRKSANRIRQEIEAGVNQTLDGLGS